jgi:hypothetical protein
MRGYCFRSSMFWRANLFDLDISASDEGGPEFIRMLKFRDKTVKVLSFSNL